MSPDGVTPPGEQPHDPWLDARVTRLEDDVGEMKATLRRLEPMIIRIDATMQHVAMKSDLEAMRSELKLEIGSVRTELKQEIGSVRSELKQEIASVRSELKQEIASVHTALKWDVAESRLETAKLRTDLLSEIVELKIALSDKPSRTYMWGIVTAMVAAFGCGLACLAILK